MPRVKFTQRSLLRIGDEKLMFNPGKMLLSETIAAEKASKLTWPQILVGLQNGVTSAIQPVVWVLRKRSNPKLQISEVEFSMDEYEKIDPDFDPEYWEVVADDYGTPGVDVIDVDDEGYPIERPQEDVPETVDEDPKAESSPDQEA